MKVIPIEPAHTLLSPSASKRWIACPDSARVNVETPAEASLPKPYADEGTSAHALLEMCLRLDSEPLEYLGQDLVGLGFPVTEAMCEAVQSALEFIADWLAKHPGSEVHIEYRVHWGQFLGLHKDISSGTSDVILVARRACCVMDYKHGAGVTVEAADNTQMMLYAVGSLPLHEAPEIEMCIVQPRARHVDGPVRSTTIDREDLMRWLRRVVAPAAHKVTSGDRSRTAGDHCRWCKAQATCRALYDASMKAAQADFDPIVGEPMKFDPAELTEKELAAALHALPMVESWAKAVHSHALAKLLEGGAVIGFKLVQGRAPPRQWGDETKAIEAAKKAKISVDAYAPRSLISPTQMEALPLHKGKAGKDAFRKAFNKLITRKDSAPHIAHDDDPRPEYVRGSEFDRVDPV